MGFFSAEDLAETRKKHVMVCVTGQLTCERLIRAGAELAKSHAAALCVVHVARKDQSFLGNPMEGDALEYLYGVSREFGADMTILRDNDALHTLAAHARRINATHIVLGVSAAPEPADFSFALRSLLPAVQIVVIRTNA